MTNDDRRIGIPPDHRVEYDLTLPMGANVPELWGHTAMKIRELHDRGITGKGVKIAINDTGIQSHDLLPSPIASGDNTGSRYGVEDRNGHGTHCAGIALGRRDSNGKALGVAPDADLIVFKVLGDNGSGSTTGINRGRIQAAEAGADVISESLGDGGGPPIRSDLDAFDKAYDLGAKICVAALGNSGRSGVGRPGSYEVNLGVAALKENMKRADYSSVGDPADVATPGSNIISAGLRNNLVGMSGTSMATPFMAGICALIIQYRQQIGLPSLQGWRQWREFLADPRFIEDVGSPGRDPEYGFGIPKVNKIVEWMLDPQGA